MTMNMSELREHVSQRFPQAEQIDDSVLCFTRDQGDQPFAVYYLDIASELPHTKESLNRYQDRLIGKRYFDGRKSLQWNNYLYFLRSDEKLASREALQAKELIENDRTYARKFVIPEKEIDAVLEPHTVAPSGVTQQENILSIWIELLTEAGLDRAILSDDDLPTRIRHIESDKRTGSKNPRPSRQSSGEPAQFLNSLELNQYRRFPLQRSFDFGTVNLVFGANASGKTSLLEAIELFFCGRNKRNPDSSSSYRLDAVLAEGQTERATSDRALRLFRDRNLTWYGQAEVRTNNLYKSFAQFNFLDTDAAVSLSESTEHIEEDLSKLLVGPDASKIWRDIERVDDEVRSKLRELRPYQKQSQTELKRLEKLLGDIASERRQSDAILERLSQMLARYNWKLKEDGTEKSLEILHGSLTELISITQQAVELEWVVSPVSFAAIRNYLRDVTHRISEAEPKLSRLKEIRKQRYQVDSAIEQVKLVRKLYDDVGRYIGSGFLDKTSEYAKIKQEIDLFSNQLSSFDPEFIKILSTIDANKTVSDSLNVASNKRLEIEAAYSSAKEEYADFAKLREESSNLAQQLRQIAGKVIETTDTPDECPLCHTQFEPGELARHMTIGVDEHLEALGQTLLTRMREREAKLDNTKRLETALVWLRQFSQCSGEHENPLVTETISRMEQVRNQLSEAHQRLEVLQKEISGLENAGLSAAQLDELLSDLKELGFPLDDYKRETVDRLLFNIHEHSSSQSELLEKLKKETSEIELALKAALSVADGEPEFTRTMSRMREQIATTKTIFTRLEEFFKEFQWPHERPISELISIGEGIRKVATEARSALAHERNVNTQQSEGLKRKEYLKMQLEKLDSRIERLSKAQAVLTKIRKDYSLNQAMESTLLLNRVAVEKIFSSIPSPAEFSGLGSSLATLVRKADNRQAKFSEISTGQRAAFGLSVFLAQNSQITAGPPVVLIDDPIAHVDDLNSLSFLDYLREIAISGKRQIFFATANDKLATLFERKFDFLGEREFRRFNLSR